MIASGMSKGFRADGEARGDSQPMYDQHGNLICALLIDLTKYQSHFSDIYLMQLKKKKTTSRFSSPL